MFPDEHSSNFPWHLWFHMKLFPSVSLWRNYCFSLRILKIFFLVHLFQKFEYNVSLYRVLWVCLICSFLKVMDVWMLVSPSGGMYIHYSLKVFQDHLPPSLRIWWYTGWFFFDPVCPWGLSQFTIKWISFPLCSSDVMTAADISSRVLILSPLLIFIHQYSHFLIFKIYFIFMSHNFHVNFFLMMCWVDCFPFISREFVIDEMVLGPQLKNLGCIIHHLVHLNMGVSWQVVCQLDPS